MEEPLILVTNDDGVHAPGIRALAEALHGLGDVWVVAPDREVSACSQSLTLKHPLRAERVEERIHAVDGTPADCVNLAVVKLLPRRPARGTPVARLTKTMLFSRTNSLRAEFTSTSEWRSLAYEATWPRSSHWSRERPR